MLKRKVFATSFCAAALVAIPGTAFAYEVQPGDTLDEVARAHGTTWRDLADRNGLPNPELILPGQHLSLAPGSARDAPGVSRTRPGATELSGPGQQAAPQSATVAGGAKEEIMRRESGGDPSAVNPRSGAVGLFQCLPSAHDCPSAGDVAGQHRWADNYVKQRYGSWDSALNFHRQHGYY